VPTLFFRRDLLDDPAVQERYGNLNGGEAIPNPPQTVAELRTAAEYFFGRDLGNGQRGYGFVTGIAPGAPLVYYAHPWLASYSVLPRGRAPVPGLFVFAPDMTPLVNTEGFLRGVKEFVETVDATIKPRLRATREDVTTELVKGSAAFALEWGDTADATVADDAWVRGKLGFSPPPGSDQYYDWQANRWDGTLEAYRVPVYGFGAWSYFIPRTAKYRDAAWEWVRYHTSPTVSLQDVASRETGYQPWRRSHAASPQPWIDAGWIAEDAKAYVQAVLDAADDPNRVLDLRLPGTPRYLVVLEQHLTRVMTGEARSPDAMAACAKDLNDITNEIGRANQIAAYKAHLGVV
jgi:multiple sugar transport system substrate-binding protein